VCLLRGTCMCTPMVLMERVDDKILVYPLKFGLVGKKNGLSSFKADRANHHATLSGRA
jgi:hypothetical protein